MLGVSAVGLATVAHLLGGGHAEPVFIALLIAAATLSSHAWLTKERGLLAITAAVVAAQFAVHLTLAGGHSHQLSVGMLLTHAGAALLLGVFLRVGEARIHAAARRRWLRLLVAVRVALAGVPQPLAASPLPASEPLVLTSLWIEHTEPGRGPPAAL